MRGDTIGSIRARLQKRWQKARGANSRRSFYPTKVFYDFIVQEPACFGIVQALVAQNAGLSEEIEAMLAARSGPIIPTDERAAAALGWTILVRVLSAHPETAPWLHLSDGLSANTGEVIGYYLEPLYDYLDEALDDQAEILSFLLRFQQWALWFGYGELAALIEAEERRVEEHGGRKQIERLLQDSMFERLFLDGLCLSTGMAREPDCGVGRSDFVFLFHDCVVATEVKLFPASGGKTGLASGLNQLLSYMDQYQTQTGYLVVFNTDPRGLRCSWAANHGGVPFVQIGDKQVYVLIVAATGQADSASGRGRADPVLLTPEDLHPGVV